MLKNWRKYTLFYGSLLSFIFFCVCYFRYVQIDYPAEVKSFEKQLNKRIDELDKFIKNEVQSFNPDSFIWYENPYQDAPFYVHIYENDSLIYWNSNELPIMHFADIHYPSTGLVKLQNGWYYVKSIRKNKHLIATSFKIKSEYLIENEFLKSEFSRPFQVNFPANIELVQEKNYPVFASDQSILFYISPLENLRLDDQKSNLLLFTFVCGLIFTLFFIHKRIKKYNHIIRISIVLGIVFCHYLLLRFDGYHFLDKISFFDPAIYSSSRWFPSFFFVIINVLFIHFLVSNMTQLFQLFSPNLKGKILFCFGGVFLALFSWFISFFYHSLVNDSSIPLEIDKLFNLNWYSLWATFSIGTVFFTYFYFVNQFYKNGIRLFGFKPMFAFWFISGIVYFLYFHYYLEELFINSLWLLLVNGVIVFNAQREKQQISFNYGVTLLFLFTAFVTITIEEHLDEKERNERELFAQQLASDQDISTEFNHFNLKNQLVKDRYFQKILSNEKILEGNEFRDFMERKYFRKFWERYEIEYYLFDEQDKPLINHSNTTSNSIYYLENILTKHSKESEIDSSVFYIKDYTSQYSYISKLDIYKKDSTKHLHLYMTFKSKRVPEKIGFPRLLISQDAAVFKQVENYSIAKYYNGKLVSQNGKYSYPVSDYVLSQHRKHATGYFDADEYNHYFYRKSSRDLIVLSKKSASFLQKLTSFSYLFCFFGIFFLSMSIVRNRSKLTFRNLTLALKIQLILISIVVVSLVFFGLGSGKFVEKQYSDYSAELIREKIKSVLIEVRQKLGDKKELTITNDGEFISFILKKFAGVFVTDINLYDQSGYLLGSSREKVYNAGLISEQINPESLIQLNRMKKSEFIHQEKIGNLQYLSAYAPLYNQDGKFLAFLNLQHFGQQKGIENQIENFLVAIINVFILLLAFSIILSILVSNWVTAPLKFIQQSLASIQLGKYNQPIAYTATDEIGSLVKNYNEKLEELAVTVQKLAQSERESAWREMAKQVAHEIKNPLTPMKLSLQHLQRIFDPNDPNSTEKLNRMIASVIEQIDALSSIANEFSNFAKMPIENKEVFDLTIVIEHVAQLFQQENDVEISLQLPEKMVILGDKELLLRVFNNLIKNAIQAIPESKKGKIQVSGEQKENEFHIHVCDNGKGIPTEILDKIFVPNFTTKSTGTGLGLAMVKQIIVLHQGEIDFETKINESTCFRIKLPANR